jgi:hypothetical protein
VCNILETTEGIQQVVTAFLRASQTISAIKG